MRVHENIHATDPASYPSGNDKTWRVPHTDSDLTSIISFGMTKAREEYETWGKGVVDRLSIKYGSYHGDFA